MSSRVKILIKYHAVPWVFCFFDKIEICIPLAGILFSPQKLRVVNDTRVTKKVCYMLIYKYNADKHNEAQVPNKLSIS